MRAVPTPVYHLTARANLMAMMLLIPAAIAGFFIAYHTGRTSIAILVPAGIGGVITMLPVLFDPKSLGFFGPVGLAVFVLLAAIPSGVGAAVGCLIGTLLRKPPEPAQNPATRRWAGAGIILVGIFGGLVAFVVAIGAVMWLRG